MYSMDLGEREQAPTTQDKAAPKQPAPPGKVAAPVAPSKTAPHSTERTWAARRKGCPQWADDVEPF
jgi:hypothetical protein